MVKYYVVTLPDGDRIPFRMEGSAVRYAAKVGGTVHVEYV